MTLPRWLPLTLLAVLLLALFYRLLLGEALFWGLPALQFYPWREFVIAELRAGRLPLWNPYNGGGAPLLANYQSAVFYPPHWIFFLLPVQWLASGMGILTVLHLFWCGVGMWLLARRWQFAPLGQTVMTLAFPLSTTLVARLGTTPMIEVAAWLPWLILTVDRLVERANGRRIAALAAVVGLLLLAGHAQWAAYSLVLAGLYALFACWQRKASRPLIFAALAVILGAGLAAAQLVPTAELQRLSQRAGGVDEAFALNFSLPPFALVTLFNPDFFGNPGDGTYAIGGAAFEIAAYIGVLPMLLALAVAWRYWRRKAENRPPHAVGFFSVVAIITLVLAFGQFTPLYPFLYRSVPTFDLFQAPARWLLLTVFSAAILAGYAAATLAPLRRALPLLRLSLAGALGLVIVALIARYLLPGLPPIAMQLAQGVAGLGGLLAVALVILLMQPPPAASPTRRVRWIAFALIFLCADLWWANSRSNPTIGAEFYYSSLDVPPEAGRLFWPESQIEPAMFTYLFPFNDYRVARAEVASYRAAGLPNLNLLIRQPSLNNFDPLRPAWHERLIDLLNDPTLGGPTFEALRQVAGLGRVVADAESQVVRPAPLRAWMVGQAIPVADNVAASQAMRSGEFDPLQAVIVEGAANMPASADPGSATITLDEPQAVVIQVESGGGWLVMDETWYPGWQATLDDQPAEIYRANVAFRAVQIPPGEHTVRMEYRPASVLVGLILSAAALVVCGGLALITLSPNPSAHGERD